jgi:hypothetical protein
MTTLYQNIYETYQSYFDEAMDDIFQPRFLLESMLTSAFGFPSKIIEEADDALGYIDSFNARDICWWEEECLSQIIDSLNRAKRNLCELLLYLATVDNKNDICIVLFPERLNYEMLLERLKEYVDMIKCHLSFFINLLEGLNALEKAMDDLGLKY